MNAYFSFFLIALFAVGCQKAAKTDATPAEQKQVETAAETKEPAPKKKSNIVYGIKYPTGWTIENGYQGTASMALSELRQATNSRATMNIAISNATVKTAKEVFDIAMLEYHKSINNISEIVDRPFLLKSGVSAHEVTFNGTVRERNMRFRILHAVKGELAFIVTAVSVIEAFDQDDIEFYEPTFHTFFLRDDAMGNNVKRQYYSIIYPENWNTTADINWADTNSSRPGGVPGTFVENIAVTHEIVTSMNLKSYVQASLRGIKAATKNFKLISQQETTLENGRKVSEIIFDQTSDKTVMRTKMIHTLESGMGYIILLTGKPETFETYEALFDATVETFRPHRK